MTPLHASAVAFDGKAALLIGPSGSGKSTLALSLISLGGVLVADDRVIPECQDEGLWLSAPDALRDRIEARGVGILRSPSKPAWAELVVDLAQQETQRIPPAREIVIEGVSLPLIHKVESAAFAAMVRIYLAGGRMG